MILFVFAFILIATCSALVVDIGSTVLEKNKISKACDAAVLAGAAELQNNPDNAMSVAQTYLEANGVSLSEATISVSDDKKSISVTASRKVDYIFAKVIGIESGNVNSNASAGIESIVGVSGGIWPFAIVDQTLIYGQNYILKEGAGDGSSGNYDILALGGHGASIVSYNIVNGYAGTLNVGESVTTETGNLAGPVTSSVESLIFQDSTSTYDACKPDSPRIITVIVVDTISVSGSKPVTIRGFASFFLEDVSGIGGHAEIVGKFIKTVGTGETSPTQTNYGLVGVKLLQ